MDSNMWEKTNERRKETQKENSRQSPLENIKPINMHIGMKVAQH